MNKTLKKPEPTPSKNFLKFWRDLNAISSFESFSLYDNIPHLFIYIQPVKNATQSINNVIKKIMLTGKNKTSLTSE